MAPHTIKPGTAIKQDVVSADGNTLIARAGTTLTEKHAELVARGKAVLVSPASRLDQATKDKIKRRLKLIFSAQDMTDPMVRELFKLTYNFLGSRLATRAGLPDSLTKKPRARDGQTDFPPAAVSPKALIDRLGEMASFPDIYFNLSQTLQRPNVSAADIAKVVSSDMVLSARLLKVVNSPFYGFRAKIDTVHRAIALTGMNELLTMALGMTAVNYFQDIPPGFITLESFWRHSIGCGLLARSLAENMEGMNPERLFTAGLLHDLGRLVMSKELPQLTATSMGLALEKRIPLVDAEQMILGFDHAQIGGELLRQWSFPDILVSLVENHHSPMHSVSPGEACLIRLADMVSNVLNASRGAPYVLAKLDPEVSAELKLPPGELSRAIDEHDEQIADLLRVFT
ncbi:MAG: HDOD domain-containing protein [Desulfovibrio sp.]|uniref:HDOD domain-containing protein n=1 Tax=Desulfovibrio sp. 7SRBS1 TaxID=3378064 RepID=UPI003B3D3B83